MRTQHWSHQRLQPLVALRAASQDPSLFPIIEQASSHLNLLLGPPEKSTMVTMNYQNIQGILNTSDR
jgi:hypothetical protein